VREDAAVQVGDEFGPSSWFEVPQERIDRFAEATEDRQWIHTDPARAQDGPFGTTIAHGYLTLSLLPAMSFEVVPRDPDARMGINYGLNRVRFPSPVPVGSRLRGSFRVEQVEPADWGVQVTLAATIEREGGEKPVCVAEIVFRTYT
jgi:acyl dehydratase